MIKTTQAGTGAGWRAILFALVIASAWCTGALCQSTSAPALHFVAIGDVPPGIIDGLVAHFRTRFGVSIKILLPLTLDRATLDEQRSQLVAERLIQAVRSRYPTLAKKPGTRVIAITPMDMYTDAMRDRWVFSFSLRSPDRHFAVVSYARMNPANFGERPNDVLLRTRLQKMIARNIGVMYFGLPLSADPRSVLFRDILGVDDLDRITEDFSPR